MLVPVYAIVALINIFAKTQNFNFKPSKNLPYEVRVRRELTDASTKGANIPDVRNKNIVNDFSNREILNAAHQNYLNEFQITYTNAESSKKYDNVVPEPDLIQTKYNKLFKKPLNVKDAGFNKETKALENRDITNISPRDNIDKNSEGVNVDVLKNDNLILEEISNKYVTQKAFDKVINTLEDQRPKPYKHVMNSLKRMRPNLLTVTSTDKRAKRSFGNNGNNQNNYNYNNQDGYQDNFYENINNGQAQTSPGNYLVAEKSTLNKAYDWVKNLVHSKEKYVITDTTYSPPYTDYDNRKNATMTSNYNWNYGNNNNTYYSSTRQNTYTVTPTYNTYNKQQYPFYSYNNYSNNNYTYKSSPHNSYTAGISPNYNQITGYNYSNQQYPHYSYGNYTSGNTFNELNPTTIYKGYNNNFASYNNNYNGKLNYSYTGVNGYGYNYSIYNNTVIPITNINGYSYNYTIYNNTGKSSTNNNNGYGSNVLFPVYNETDSDDYTTTETTVVVESCAFCGTFGCPVNTKRVGFKCIPIKRH